ncbi:MAG: ABC transporter ATP-binding protein/permease [Thermoflexales bacterium]|nr:ABC transporter ATP-binding protein/permease [Thermoflexales bacterium]
MGMFSGLASEAYDRQYTDRQLAQRLLHYARPHARDATLTLITMAGLTVLSLADPLVVSRALDLLRSGDASIDRGALLAGLIGLLLAFAVMVWLGNLLRRRAMARLVANMIAQMRRDAFDAVIHHDLSFFDKYQSGKLISRISNDTQELAQVVTLVADLGNQFATLVILLIILLGISVPMTLAVAAAAPLVALAAAGFRKLARTVTRNGFRAIADVNSAIQEAVAGIRVAKNFSQEAAMYDGFRRVNQRSFAVNVRRGLVLSNIFPTLNALTGIGTAVLLLVGANTVKASGLSLGALYLFITSLDRFWFPMTNLASFYSQIQSGFAASERIFALIDAEASVKQHANAAPFTLTRGEIRFERLGFRYNAQQQVLTDFDLTIKPGESVAFVGHTGAGKSSLAKLIGRSYEFQSGRLLIDGRDIRDFDLPSYRRQLGFVSQSPFLFAGTVADNIRYAAPELSDDALREVAVRIGHGEWLDSLPNGLATEVGERGGALSLGQRQLVALARVMAQHPKVFILDEATASVDPFTEAQIQAALDVLLKSSTSILIAHRLSTVKAVDRIIVLDHGRIIQQGGHNALMAQGGHYATLYDTYFRHQSADYQITLDSHKAVSP